MRSPRLSALESALVSQNIAFAGLSSFTCDVKERFVSLHIRCCAGIEVKEIWRDYPHDRPK
jgi:hypothetical protein